jgi:hypothetical protein
MDQFIMRVDKIISSYFSKIYCGVQLKPRNLETHKQTVLESVISMPIPALLGCAELHLVPPQVLLNGIVNAWIAQEWGGGHVNSADFTVFFHVSDQGFIDETEVGYQEFSTVSFRESSQ